MRKIIFYQFFIILLLFCGISGRAQEDLIKSEFSYRRYSVSDGLPENYCWDVFQDSKGYIWTATYNGFARYDGQQFMLYWQDKQTNVQNITENNEGNISALSYSYYAVLDPVADTLKLIYNTGWRLIPFVSQNMPTGYFFYELTGTENKSLFQLSDTGLVKVWEHKCLSKMDNFRKPFWDKENRIFYIPTKDYIYIVNEENNIIQDSIVNQSILTIFPYGKSIAALGTDGIYKYENRKFIRIYNKSFFYNPSGLQAFTDRENRIVIRDVINLYRFDGKNLEHIFNNSAFFNILFDTHNNLWTATYEGLYNLFSLQFRNYSFVKNNNFARTLCADNEKVWIGTYQGRLFNIKNNIVHEEKTPKANDSYFQGVSAKIGNHLFFPGGYVDGDILHYNGKKGLWMNLPNMAYSFVLPLKNDTVLFGSNQGIIIYNYSTGKIIRNFSRNELNNQPACAAIDVKRRILIGGSTGITVIDGDSIYMLDKMTDFLSCRTIITDETGKVWAASNNKLFSIDNDSMKLENSFEYPVRGLFITGDNILIILTLRGIHIKKPGYEDFIYYDRNNGFMGEKNQMNQPVEDNEGNIWFLADKSVVRFNPNELLQKQTVPRLHFQHIMSSKDNINWKDTEQGIYKFGHRSNNIKFQYIGLNYSAVDNLRYHYRLLGFQNDWSKPNKNREVTFNNLPPGNYVFDVYSDAGTNESRSEMQSFTFCITPAFWQTTWFFILSIVSLMFVSFSVALHIQRRKNKELLEKLHAEKELNELRISSIRLKAIPHFNANVLAAIEYYIANRSKEEAMRILGIYSDFTFKTLNDVDKAARSLSEELAYVKMYLDLEKIRFLDKFDFQINMEEGVNKDVQLPNMILHTYCENAVKHGLMPLKSGGLLTINISQRDRIVFLYIEDNGVGRENAGKNPHIHSTKQGLSILNRQIEIYNNFNQEKIIHQVDDLFVDEKPSGTRFKVEIPLDFEYIN